MDTRLQLRLNSVARRLRSLHLGWTLTAIWLLAAALGCLLLTMVRAGALSGGGAAVWLIGCTGIGAVAAILYHALHRTDFHSLAQRLEDRFPSLDKSLLTATDLRPSTPDGGFSYLQRSVISQALRHDLLYQWRRLVSAFQVTWSWLANVPALLFFGLVVAALWNAPSSTTPAEASSVSSVTSGDEPLVLPGDTEIERGTSLIVTARFAGKLPDEVWLERSIRAVANDSASSDESAVESLPMRQSLKDPVFAAYLYDLDRSMEYRIRYDGAMTRDYRVEVFEFPALVRADAVLDYPGYTQLEKRTVVDTRRVTAAVGTTLTWQLHLNKPVVSAELVSEDEEPIALEPSSEDPFMVSAEIVLRQSTNWQLKLLDADGRKNSAEVTLRARVLPNKEASIRLTTGGDVQVSPLQEFDIAAEIKDDFAVDRAGIAYQFGGGRTVELQSEIAAGSGKSVKISELVDFEALEAEPNQLLSYYVWAEDRDQEGAVRRVTSDMFFAEVRPFDEIFRQGEQPSGQQGQGQGQQPGNQQTEELLELQKQIVVGSWNVLRTGRQDQLPESAAADIELLIESQQQAVELLKEKAQESGVDGAEQIIGRAGKSMGQAVEQLTAAAESLASEDLSQAVAHEQTAYQELLRLQSREHEVIRSQRSQSSSSSSRSQARQRQIDQLELDNQENRYESERLAQDQQNQEQAELRQIISRLRELAARQEDLNEQLRELEAALQAAETAEERDQLRQQLERLREQQQQMLQDSDELQERLETQSDEELQAAQEQMQQARENLQQSSEALRQGNTGQALAAGTRAEAELKQLQDEVRQQAANQFAESMQDMRQQAAELEQRQDEIVEQMSRAASEPTAGLRATEEEQTVEQEVVQQQARLEQLLENMQQTVEQAEDAEPLLAQKLYDSYRRTKQGQVEERLEQTEQLLRLDYQPQARELAGQSIEDLAMLREDIDAAAEAVLGSELDSLRLALNQLETLSSQLDNEIAQATGRDPASRSEQGMGGQKRSATNEQAGANENPNASEATSRKSSEDREAEGIQQQASEQSSGQQSEQRQQSGQQETGQQPTGNSPAAQPNENRSPGQQQSGQQQSGQEQSGQQQSGQQQSGQQQSGQQQSGQQQSGQQQSGQQQSGQQQSGQQQSGQQSGEQRANQPSRSGRRGASQPRSQPQVQQGLRGSGKSPEDPGSVAGWSEAAEFSFGGNPITGEAFRDWSDRLRDVEELVVDPELRWEATQIRQAAREIRREVKKHAADPRWSEVEDLVAKPLRELQRRVSDELIRRAAKRTEIVPIDRDPVPTEFSRSVQRYYENLGRGL